MSPTDKSTVLCQLNEDLASVIKSSEPLTREDTSEQLQQCQEDYDKCSAYVTELFNQLEKGT